MNIMSIKEYIIKYWINMYKEMWTFAVAFDRKKALWFVEMLWDYNIRVEMVELVTNIDRKFEYIYSKYMISDAYKVFNESNNLNVIEYIKNIQIKQVDNFLYFILILDQDKFNYRKELKDYFWIDDTPQEIFEKIKNLWSC